MSLKPWRRPWWPLPAIALALLTGCGAAPSEVPRPCARVPLVSYSQDVRNRVANELEAAPDGAAWPGMIEDYSALRAAERAAQEACGRER